MDSIWIYNHLPVVSGNTNRMGVQVMQKVYDLQDRCSVKGCSGKATVWYPLLENCPSFCSKHHTPEYAEPFGCDFSGPDDFEIPVGDEE